MLKKSLPLKILVCVLVMQVLGGLGAFITVGGIESWYSTLNKPPGTPPNWLFGPVWATLYALIGISFAIVWQKASDPARFRECVRVFVLQLVLNLLWTPIFFGAHQMTAALLVIVTLLVAIVMTIFHFRKVSALAAGLLIPYLLWVSYATYLNAGYVVLN